jgi:hypothetical protein
MKRDLGSKGESETWNRFAHRSMGMGGGKWDDSCREEFQLPHPKHWPSREKSRTRPFLPSVLTHTQALTWRASENPLTAACVSDLYILCE